MRRALLICLIASFILSMAIPALARQHWRSTSSSQTKTVWFKGVRLGFGRTRYNIRFEAHGEDETPVVLSIFERGHGGIKLKTRLTLAKEFRPVAFEIITHRRSGTTFLTYSAGAQFPHTYVWAINPKTLRVRHLVSAMLGDTDALDKGILVEHSPAHYWYVDLPERTVDDRYVVRIWRYQARSMRFVARKWRKEGHWTGGRPYNAQDVEMQQTTIRK